jgi:hypothetical protein
MMKEIRFVNSSLCMWGWKTSTCVLLSWLSRVIFHATTVFMPTFFALYIYIYVSFFLRLVHPFVNIF